MRTKKEILRDASVTTMGMMSELELEVLIDMRDQLTLLDDNIACLVTTLENIETKIGGQ